jgi:hypothetical protein
MVAMQFGIEGAMADLLALKGDGGDGDNPGRTGTAGR